MVDYDIYNERRQQLIEVFTDEVFDFVDILGLNITTLVDLLDWEDNATLARLMGWTIEDDE